MITENGNTIQYKYVQNVHPRVKPEEMQGRTDWDTALKLLDSYSKRKEVTSEMFKYFLHKSAASRFKTKGNIGFVRCPANMTQEEANIIHNKDCKGAIKDRVSNFYYLMTETEALEIRNLIPTRVDAVVTRNIFKNKTELI